ncbi:hypothetical protein [Nocardiopsis sp. MG754419]|uniref:hypothetical protein n=1 Tax=Nocardiopsis sp. MG754419 TaxID=2259865 RepID=UPI001BACF503|nr:hypothetical protein [Nocardiopsis sp. MG754419]MBR8742893.1 hypothetical protein [Nocardiopsis sp. MG754419]
MRRPLHHQKDRDLALDDAGAETMRALTAAGVGHARARAYVDAGWRGPEAVPWARAGVPATPAVLYRCLGLLPTEAARRAASGTDAEALLRAWWDSGVPRAETASWIVSGATPEQAAVATAMDAPARTRRRSDAGLTGDAGGPG